MTLYKSIAPITAIRKARSAELQSIRRPGKDIAIAAGGGSGLATGAMTVEEIVTPGYTQGTYDGGQLYYSSDGEGEWVKCIAFGGTGTMSGAGRSSLLGQSMGLGFSTYNDFVIDGGNKRLVCLQMYFPGAPPYPLGQFSAIQNAVAWLQANYPGSGNLNKVIMLCSSQGGNNLRWAFSYNYAWSVANILGSINGAAELPTDPGSGYPDMTGIPVYAIHGENDTGSPGVSYAQAVQRRDGINAVSSGSPITLQNLAGVGHVAYTWGNPFEVNRNWDDAVNDYSGVIKKINDYVSTV